MKNEPHTICLGYSNSSVPFGTRPQRIVSDFANYEDAKTAILAMENNQTAFIIPSKSVRANAIRL